MKRTDVIMRWYMQRSSKMWSDRVMSREFERQKKRTLEGMAP